MKKLVMTAAVLAYAASIASAQTVTSANMVGYAKVEAIEGQLTLVALNFQATNSVNALLGSQLPTGTTLHIWDKGIGGYVSTTKPSRGAWAGTIDLGEAFWIQPAAGSGTNTIILSGEVLLSETNSTAIAAGIDATGYFYPVDAQWGTTDLAVQMPVGSTLHVWDTGLQTYKTYTKASRGTYGGWGDTAGTTTIGLANGFWVQSAGGVSWDEERPFTP